MPTPRSTAVNKIYSVFLKIYRIVEAQVNWILKSFFCFNYNGNEWVIKLLVLHKLIIKMCKKMRDGRWIIKEVQRKIWKRLRSVRGSHCWFWVSVAFWHNTLHHTSFSIFFVCFMNDFHSTCLFGKTQERIRTRIHYISLVLVLGLPLTRCVTLGKSCNFSDP